MSTDAATPEIDFTQALENARAEVDAFQSRREAMRARLNDAFAAFEASLGQELVEESEARVKYEEILASLSDETLAVEEGALEQMDARIDELSRQYQEAVGANDALADQVRSTILLQDERVKRLEGIVSGIDAKIASIGEFVTQHKRKIQGAPLV